MATTAGSIYSETLQSIIDAKLGELERKRSVFEKSKASLLASAARQTDDSAKLQVLVSGVKTTFGIRSSSDGKVVTGSSKHPELEQKLANLERFLAQVRYDPSVSPSLLARWEDDLHQQLGVQSSRFDYAALYAQLVTEWLTAEKKIDVKQEASGDLEMSGFEEIESKQMLEARAEWSKTVFEPYDTDTVAIEAYLNKLFGAGNPHKRTLFALERVRKSVQAFQHELAQPNQFNEYVLRWVINGLLSTDLLTEDKRNVLRDFLPNSIILNELADVLNLRISSIDTWNWGDRVTLESKRKIQGHFHIVMHEDLLQAIFLQYIGVKWSVCLKNALNDFLQTEGAWLSAERTVTPNDAARRKWFIGADQTTREESLQSKRDALWRASYFMSQLPESEHATQGQAEGEVEADFAPAAAWGSRARQVPGSSSRMVQQAPPPPMAQQAHMQAQQQAQLQAHQQSLMMLQQQPAAKRMRRVRTNGNDEQVKRPENPTQAKQTLLHLLNTEMLINNHLYGGLTAFRGQFESWNPLLSHTTILTVMKYLGASERWLQFFRKFLEAPLGFDDEDEVRIRRRGIPGNHALSDFLGEAILFCLDLSINQATKGSRFWRVHDDFWFWSTDDDKSVIAWNTIVDFSKLMGLSLDHSKCGGTRAGTGATRLADLIPQDTIRWGFLHLDSAAGQFQIDQKLIDRHIADLQRQLQAKTKSIFSWIEAWNAYADTFFTTNFGRPVNCFGQQHIDQILSTLERVQRKIFDDDKTAISVVGYLKATLAERFGVQDIPDGYVFWPSPLGGLEVRNPFVVPLQKRHAVFENPAKRVAKFTAQEQEDYRKAKERFERGEVQRPVNNNTRDIPADADTFFGFEEYARFREEFDGSGVDSLSNIFLSLMRQPGEDTIEGSTEIMTALNLMDTAGVIGQEGKCGINGDWHNMTPYWKWILGMYGPEVLRRFGGLNIVDNGVLPIGMVSLLRGRGVSWSG